jgi:hypothetical protein
MNKVCGNLKVKCRYRGGIKYCKKPKKFKCKEIINSNWNKEE